VENSASIFKLKNYMTLCVVTMIRRKLMPSFSSFFSPTQNAVAAGFAETWVTINSKIVQTEFAIFMKSSISPSLKYVSYAFLTKLSYIG